MHLRDRALLCASKFFLQLHRGAHATSLEKLWGLSNTWHGMQIWILLWMWMWSVDCCCIIEKQCEGQLSIHCVPHLKALTGVLQLLPHDCNEKELGCYRS